MTWEELLLTKVVLWIDMRSNTDNILHGTGRIVDTGTLIQIDKASETDDDLMCYVFSLEDALAHISVTNPSGILTIEK